MLPEGDTKTPRSITIVEEHSVQAKLRVSRVEAGVGSFSTRPLGSDAAGGIVACRDNSVIQDDRIPDVRVTFRVHWCTHPKFDGMGVLSVVQVEIWENGVCSVIIEAAVCIRLAAVMAVAPNDCGSWWLVVLVP